MYKTGVRTKMRPMRNDSFNQSYCFIDNNTSSNGHKRLAIMATSRSMSSSFSPLTVKSQFGVVIVAYKGNVIRFLSNEYAAKTLGCLRRMW